MKCVLYTEDLEPITVIDLPLDVIFLLKKDIFRVWRIAVPGIVGMHLPEEMPQISCDIVDIWAERFHRKGVESLIFFTRNEELALRLKSEVLPGQQNSFNSQFKLGFIHGVLAASR